MPLTLEVKFTDEQLAQIAEIVARNLRLGAKSTYTRDEAAKLLGVHPETISRRVQAKVYPRVPNIKALRIPASFIDGILNPQNPA